MFQALLPISTQRPMKLGVFHKQKIHLLVQTANVTVQFAGNENDLISPPPFAPSAGLQLDSTAGWVEFEYTGELWARCSSTTPAYLQFDA